MGKCLSCLRVDQHHKDSASHCSLELYNSSVSATCHTQTARTNSDSATTHCFGGTNYDSPHQGVPLSAQSSTASYGRRTPVLYNSESNGTHSNKLSGIMGVTGGSGGGASSGGSNSSDKRSFYARIPPLTRSASRETRRHSSKDTYSETKINTLFDVYRETDANGGANEETEDVILIDGIQKFCIDLDISPDDFRILLFAWKCEAETMCRFTRSEFLQGCKSIKADSIKGILSKFPDLVVEAQEFDKFKNMYKWAFKFGLDNEVNQRILPTDMAIPLWKLVFEHRKPKILERWLDFLKTHQSIRGIPRDTWNMFLNFSEVIGEDLSTYDDTEAWPSLFDDFVEYENDRLNQNISKDTIELQFT